MQTFLDCEIHKIGWSSSQNFLKLLASMLLASQFYYLATHFVLNLIICIGIGWAVHTISAAGRSRGLSGLLARWLWWATLSLASCELGRLSLKEGLFLGRLIFVLRGQIIFLKFLLYAWEQWRSSLLSHVWCLRSNQWARLLVRIGAALSCSRVINILYLDAYLSSFDHETVTGFVSEGRFILALLLLFFIFLLGCVKKQRIHLAVDLIFLLKAAAVVGVLSPLLCMDYIVSYLLLPLINRILISRG